MVHFSWLRSKFRRAAAHNHNQNHNQNHSKNASGPLSWSKSEMAPQRSLSARENWGSRGGGDWPSCSTLHWGSDSCPNSSSSSPPEEDVKNDEMIAQVLSEELSHGDDVGKRLTHLPSIPHQPKVNTAIRPTQDDASLDHERHLERLNLYGLREAKMMGDGNCQFRALSHQIYFTPEYHKFIRKQVVKQLRNQRDLYEGYVPMKYGEYLKKMSRAGEWGDHVTLQAAADHNLLDHLFQRYLLHRNCSEAAEAWTRCLLELLVRGALQFCVYRNRSPLSIRNGKKEETLVVFLDPEISI